MDESKLIACIHGKDTKAIKALSDAYFSKVILLVGKNIRDEREAEEVAIHCFAVLWEQNLTNISSILEVEGLLYSISKKAAKDFLAKQKTKLPGAFKK